MAKRAPVLVASGLLLTCRPQPSGTQQPEVQEAATAQIVTTVQTLTSGKIVNVISIEETMLERMGRTLIFEYLTDLTIHDHRAVQTEVEEIWDNIRAQAEETDVDAVFIIPNETTGGGSVSFVIRRNEDGSWRKSGGFIHAEPKPNSEQPNER